MPLTHVAGLLLLHLIPLCSGANEVVVSTEDFLRNPRGFFDYVKKYKGTVTNVSEFCCWNVSKLWKEKWYIKYWY